MSPSVSPSHPAFEGWGRLAALTAGLVFFLSAFPPFDFWPGIFLGLGILSAASLRRFWHWWLLGALAQGALIAWLIKVTFFGWLGLSLFLGIFWALPFWLWRRTQNRLLAASLWVTLEALRTFLGFGWLPLAASMTSMPLLLNWAAGGGEGLLGFIIVFLSFSLGMFLERRTWRSGAQALIFFTLTGIMGLSFSQHEPVETRALRIALVQPATPMPSRTDSDFRRELESLSILSNRLRAASPDFYFWPEQCTPWPANDDPTMRRWLEDGADYLGAPIISGVLWHRPPTSAAPEEYFNAASVIAPGSGLSTAYYAKRRLVPFGEFIPFAGLARSFTPNVDSFSAGACGVALEARSPSGARLTLWPLVCYEDAFDYLSWDVRADALAVFSNDAWFGWQSSPWPFATAQAERSQHAAHSVLRAVEQGLPVVRISNDGLSGIVSPDGDTLHPLDPLSPQSAVVTLTLGRHPTLYALCPIFWRAGILLLLLLTLAYERHLQARKAPPLLPKIEGK